MKQSFTVIKTISFIALVLFSLSACNRGKKIDAAENLPPGTHAVSVIEVIQTSNYTYLQVFENDQKFWMAVTRMEAKNGDVLYYTNAMEMKDFKSKELNRVFPSILFVNDPSLTPPTMKKMGKSTGKITAERLKDFKVEPVNGGITIAELYGNKSKYNDKPVKIRGVVVKFSKNIMGKNWVHIQDGTESGNSYDLTITTMDFLDEGSVVTFEGIIRLDKDFGSGYAYDVIMEEAKSIEIKVNEDATL
ncbi:MAG: nucleic acid binding OB-fold tRNA/helicase-type [Bacteroidetes bacterium]|nr:MAG: nucleic acid binding OB-fold tRNA/helicase-type [Bacteroidota bacterium]